MKPNLIKLVTLLLLVAGAFSCIKKRALKYDPELVGLWVSKEDSVYTWLEITADGIGDYSTHGNTESKARGEVKYSLFELKMWVDRKKFKVLVWRTKGTNGVSMVQTKERGTLKDTTYYIDEMMVLKSKELFNRRSITLYRVKK